MPKYHQLIFIDDSGDPGFKFSHGSTRYFVIAAIIFESREDAETTNNCIKLLEQQMNYIQKREFKYYQTSNSQKRKFFNSIKNQPFKIRAIILDKTKIEKTQSVKNKSLYFETIKRLLREYENMDRARIYLDGGGSRNYRHKISSMIRKSVNTKRQKIVEFRLVDSEDNTLIQLADMVAGAIRSKYDKKHTMNNYLKIIDSRIEEIKFI